VKPARFQYCAPSSVEEAVAFLAEHADESSVLAGGQSLVPLLNMRLARPEYVVDLNRVPDLDYVRADNDVLAVGALTRHATLENDQLVRDDCPLVARAMPHVGHAGIRYRGTAGGSIAHADPSAELPAVAVALDAQVVVRGPQGTRTVRAGDFFITHLTTSLEQGEIVTELRFPVRREESGSAVVEIARRHGDFALVGVATQVELADGVVRSARLAAFGVDDVPRRLTDAEALLVGAEPSAELLEGAGAAASAAVEPASDMHASAEYRREMAAVLVRRSLRDALAEAGAQIETDGGNG
jgi:CO/xanthine dehydrogenase FAD-binding subunit